MEEKLSTGSKFKAEAEAYKQFIICPVCFKNNDVEILSVVRDKPSVFMGYDMYVEIESKCKECFVKMKHKYSLPPIKPENFKID